jgi:hypothetical protein
MPCLEIVCAVFEIVLENSCGHWFIMWPMPLQVYCHMSLAVFLEKCLPTVYNDHILKKCYTFLFPNYLYTSKSSCAKTPHFHLIPILHNNFPFEATIILSRRSSCKHSSSSELPLAEHCLLSSQMFNPKYWLLCVYLQETEVERRSCMTHGWGRPLCCHPSTGESMLPTVPCLPPCSPWTCYPYFLS